MCFRLSFNRFQHQKAHTLFIPASNALAANNIRHVSGETAFDQLAVVADRQLHTIYFTS